MMKNSSSISDLLNNPKGDFGQILQRVKELRNLTRELHSIVDSPLNQHIFVSNIRDDTLIIGTESAVWHTRIKYLAPMILEHMRSKEGLSNLQRIEFRVHPIAAQQDT